MRRSKPANDRRNQLIKLIHVARRELGMQDEDYRNMLANMPALGGRTSSADLSIKGLELVLEALKAKGFRVRAKGPNKVSTRRLADDPQAKLARHYWLCLRDAGVLRDSSEKALNSYVKRITKVDDLAWLDQSQINKVIESLKNWCDRSIKTMG
jgi:phage gp16-like protein